MAQPASDWRLIGQVGGPVQAVAVAGKYAYVGVGSRLVVLDVSNPAAPLEVGNTTPFPNFVQGVAVSGRRACIAAGSGGLRIVDVSNPALPVEIGAAVSPGYAEGVAVSGNTVFLANGPSGLRILDISDPTKPREVGHAFEMNYAFQVALAGNQAVIASGGAGLLVADVSNPAQPVELASVVTPGGYAFGVSVANGTAYVAAGWGGVQLVSLSDPTHPVLAGSCSTPGWALGTAVSGGRLFVADGGFGLLILDTTTLQVLGTFETDQAIYGSVNVAGNSAYVCDRRAGLRILNVADVTHPIAAASLATIGAAQAVAISDTRAFVVESDGVRTVDLSDPAHPALAALFALPSAGGRIASFGQFAIFTGGVGDSSGMYVVDVSDPARPVKAGFMVIGDSTNPFGPFRDIQIVGNTLYTADEWGLLIIDLSNPRQPRQIGFARLIDWPVPGSFNPVVGVAVANGFAYVTASDGVKVVDVSDPTKPTPVAVYHSARHNGGAITISGGLAYVSHGNGTDVLSLANSRQPTLVTDFDGLSETVQTKLVGNQLLAADEGLGVGVIDLANPQQPRRFAWVNTAGYAQDLAVTSTLALVADAEAGVAVLGRAGSTASAVAFAPRPVAAIVDVAAAPPQPADARPPQIPAPVVTTNSLVVTSAQDSGTGTLRALLTSATRGTSITFDLAVFPPASPTTIHLLSGLPALKQGGVVIDASNAGVVLDGSQAGGGSGLTISSDGNAVMGLQLLRFGGTGISLTSASNRIGGSRIQGSGPAGQGNVIGNCGFNGIELFGDATTNNLLLGNLIGIGLHNEALPNLNGVSISGSAHANYVGGSTAPEQNIISANKIIGVSVLIGAHDNVIAGNLIGTNLAGTQAVGAQQAGVSLQSPRNRVGGPAPADRNVIAGAAHTNVVVTGTEARGNLLVGNYLSITAGGDVALPNGDASITLQGGANHTWIENNVIGPTGTGAISIGDPPTAFNTLVRNFIGTDVTGTHLLPGDSQVQIDGGFTTRIGGTDPKDRNVIAGTLALGFGGSSAIVLGNYIGLDRSGTRSFSQSGPLIALRGGARRPFIGGLTAAEGNSIGGSLGAGLRVEAGADFIFIAGNRFGLGIGGESLPNAQDAIQLNYSSGSIVQQNVIATNGGAAVQLVGGAGDSVRRNAIYANTGAAIALASGGNRNLAAPVISSATATAVAGTAPPGSVIEIFSDAAGQGAIYEGSVTVDGSGAFRFTGSQPMHGPNLTATATDFDGSTSFFSTPRSIAAASTGVAPSITASVQNQTVSFGGTAVFSLSASGSPAPTYRWQGLLPGGSGWTDLSDGAVYAGTATSTLTVTGGAAAINGAQFRGVVTNAAGVATSAAAALSVQFSSLANLSVLTNVTAAQPLVAGFVASGGGEQVLVRAIGPGLEPFLPGAQLARDPRLELYDGASALVQSNDNWGGAASLTAAFTRVGAFALPVNSLDAAVLTSVAGATTARFVASASGKGLLEVYAADATPSAARLINLSVFNLAGGGDNVLTAGFVITGNVTKTLLIRGIGPALAQFGVAGVLANPRLDLYRGSVAVASNDDWSVSPDAAQISAAAAAVGAFALPVGNKDAAMLVTLPPGAYTAQISSADISTGLALAEVYEVP